MRTPIVNPPSSAPAAYPITGLTFLLIPTNAPDAQKLQITARFIEYIVGQGQSFATGLHYAMLPVSITRLDRQLLAQLKTNKTQAMK